MIELKTRNGQIALVVGCLPEGRGVGYDRSFRLLGAIERESFTTWTAAWRFNGQITGATGGAFDLMDIPPDIEERLSGKPKPGATSPASDATMADAKLHLVDKLRGGAPTLGCTSYIQRKLCISYNLASAMMSVLEAEGFISPADNNGARRLLGG